MSKTSQLLAHRQELPPMQPDDPVSDAFGYLCLNLELTANARQKLFEWLGIA